MMANQPAAVRTESRHPLRTSIVFGLALAMLHGYLASIYIDHPPLYDEMYHMLAAESWRTSGELRILDGEYLRASLFTKMVGLNANICGPSLECARGISVAASVLLVFLVTVFAGTAMHPAVGFVAGLLAALNPAVIAASQYIRFYSLHALVFFVFAAMFIFWLRTGGASPWARALRSGALQQSCFCSRITCKSFPRWACSQSFWEPPPFWPPMSLNFCADRVHGFPYY
jgi:hypothetical protein